MALDDHNLVKTIRGKKRTLENAGRRLPVKGEKLQVNIKRLEEELERRIKRRIDKKGTKGPLQVEWNALLQSKEGDAPVSNTAASTCQQQNSWTAGFDRQFSWETALDDHNLVKTIRNKKRTLENAGRKLPDKGEKLQVDIKRLEEELERRIKRRIDKGEPMVLDVESESHHLEETEQ